MTWPVRLEAEAAEELLVASSWYEEQLGGLGLEFLQAAQAAVEQIARMPSAGALVPHVPEELRVRRVLIRRFPYAVAYLVMDEEVRVLAFAHTSRRPGYWLHRHPDGG